jgi:hypothetical protein
VGLNTTSITQRIAALGLTANAAARLSGISPSRISEFSRGGRDLNNDEQRALCQIVSEAEALVNDFPDHPFDFRQIGRIRDLLDSRREAVRVGQDEELVNIALGNEGDLFACRADSTKGVPEVRTVRFAKNAAFVNRITAGMLVTALHNSGYRSARIVVNLNPGLAVSEKFGKLWFTENDRATYEEQPAAPAAQKTTARQ